MRIKEFVKRPFMRMLMSVGRRVRNLYDRPVQICSPRRALVIQIGGVGDIIRVFPLLERLQAAYPDTDIGLFTNQGTELLDLYPGPRRPRHVPFDLKWSYPRKWRELAKLRRAGVDLIVNPARGDGMLECAIMAWLIGAPHRIGFDQDGAGFLHTHKQPFSGAHSILEQNLLLLKPLGVEAGESCVRLRIPEPARAFAADWYTQHVPLGVLRVVVHPWASSHREFREWPFGRYVEMIERFLEERNAFVLILGCDSEAAADRERLAKLPHGRVRDLVGATGLAEAAALIAGCDLFVGNDSGLLHMALAANVATVGVFGATPPDQVLHTSTNAVALVAGFPCQPCYRHQPLFDYHCRYGFRCLEELPVSAVLGEALRLAPNRF
jgi:ADP-heptose:LPS heptosyltransferase